MQSDRERPGPRPHIQVFMLCWYRSGGLCTGAQVSRNPRSYGSPPSWLRRTTPSKVPPTHPLLSINRMPLQVISPHENEAHHPVRPMCASIRRTAADPVRTPGGSSQWWTCIVSPAPERAADLFCFAARQTTRRHSIMIEWAALHAVRSGPLSGRRMSVAVSEL